MVWYQNIEPLINHVSDANFYLIFLSLTLLYIDEMMLFFVGKSTDTHQMKNKPISEG